MKTYIALTAMALLASPAWAKHWDGSPEMESSIINVHADHWPHRAGDSHEAKTGDGTVYDFDLRQGHFPHTPGDSHEATQGDSYIYGTALSGSDSR